MRGGYRLLVQVQRVYQLSMILCKLRKSRVQGTKEDNPHIIYSALFPTVSKGQQGIRYCHIGVEGSPRKYGNILKGGYIGDHIRDYYRGY